MERLIKAIETATIAVFAKIDHAAEARQFGMAMPPTIVLIQGHPKGGTPIMRAPPQTALYMPLRVQVREAPDGRVMVSFHPVAPILRRAGFDATFAARL